MTALQPPWATGTGGDTTTDDENSEWAPSNEPLSTFGVAEPGHGDVEDANPETESYGRDTGGTTPDVRKNLLTDVREAAAAAAPVIEHHHVMETIDVGVSQVRARVVRVIGNTDPVRLLEQNPNRVRALIKVVTSASVVMVAPGNQGGNIANIAVPTGNQAAFPLATGEPMLEVKSSAAVDGFGTVVAPGFVDIAIWEETTSQSNLPGLT